jgi:hypothetical protein
VFVCVVLTREIELSRVKTRQGVTDSSQHSDDSPRSSVSWTAESNGSVGAERLSHSMPGSPADRKPNFEVIGSAESLVGRVSF